MIQKIHNHIPEFVATFTKFFKATQPALIKNMNQILGGIHDRSNS